MPNSWLSWRRSLACKTQPGEVHDPQSLHAESTARAKVEAAVFVSRRVYMRSGCSRSIANLRDVIHSSRRIDSGRVPAMPNFSPKSVESNDFVQSIAHETLLHEHGCDNHAHYKHPQHQQQGKLVSLDDIVANHHPHPHHHHHKSNGTTENITTNVGSRSFYGTPLHPSAQGAYAHPATPIHQSQVAPKGNSFRKLSGCYDCKNPAVSLVVYKTSTVNTAAVDARNGSNTVEGSSTLPPVAVPKAVCQRCGEAFFKYEALEQHHVLKHAVAELEVGDSSRNVVEIIFRTSWLRRPEPILASTSAATGGAGQSLKIERVLKVNNLARTLARFEDYREGVKIRASKLPKKHPRCLADGNELLRFYGARLECELLQAAPGVEGPGSIRSATACSSMTCSICKIIRTGFPKFRGPDAAANRGITTTATSGRAHQLMVGDLGGSADVGLQAGTTLTEHSKSSASACPKLAAREGFDVAVGACSSRQDEVTRRRASGGTNTGMMAMLVCRVIAGRVHKPPHTTSATTAPSTPPHNGGGDLGPPGAGFDSVAGGELGANGSLPPPAGMGLHSRFEELTVFNPRAILPCFVVVYRC